MPQAESAGIALLLEVGTPSTTDDRSPLYVRGDKDRVRQLILALLENALRYTPRGGDVRVSITMESGRRFLVGHRSTWQWVSRWYRQTFNFRL
jgi:signal transduction histidine kinase